MEFLQSILDNSQYAFVTAFILGLMTTLSPCPLAVNISAMGYISKDIKNKKTVFYNGLIYTLGRAFSYTLLAVIIFLGADQLNISMFLQRWGEKILGPLLIIIGFFMLDVFKLKIPFFSKLSDKISSKNNGTYWGSFALGTLFAMAFCPYSGVLYFGVLIPMTIASPSGLLLPPVFAIATGLPVIIIAWLLAYSVSNVGKFYNKMSVFQKWFKWIVAAIFIVVGIYYIITGI